MRVSLSPHPPLFPADWWAAAVDEVTLGVGPSPQAAVADAQRALRAAHFRVRMFTPLDPVRRRLALAYALFGAKAHES